MTQTYTVIRHPSRDGWTFVNSACPRAIKDKRRKARASAFHVLWYLQDRNVPWWQVVWPFGKETR